MQKRIVILRSDDAHHEYLEALLRQRFNVVATVVEPGVSQRRRLRVRRKYVDYTYNLYHHLRRTVLGLNTYRRGYFGDLPATPPDKGVPTLTVDWINDPRVVELLKQAAPEVTVIICTSILGKEVLEAAGKLVLNVHGGYLPYYRGNHCFFFALYRGDFSRIGSTIHCVDPGIDTGNIVEVVVPPIRSTDNAEMLYCRAEKMAIHRLVEWLEFYERGGELPRRTHDLRTPLNRTRDRKPYHDILLWLKRKTGSFVVPDRPAPPREVEPSGLEQPAEQQRAEPLAG